MQRRISTEHDLLSLSIAQDHVRKRRLVTLGVSEQPAVEAELVDDLRFDLPCELGVEHFVGVLPEVRRSRQPTQEVRPALPAPIEELRLVDEGCPLAHRLRRLLRSSLKVLARVRADVTRQVDMPAALRAQPIQLLALVSLSVIADESGVWVINRPRLATLAARDRVPLLR